MVVPKGGSHRPASEDECHILLVEPSGDVNAGDAGGERKAPNYGWVRFKTSTLVSCTNKRGYLHNQEARLSACRDNWGP